MDEFPRMEERPYDGWHSDGHRFVRYRMANAKGSRYQIESQQNGGGSLTTRAVLEVAVEKRKIIVDGKENTIRVLRVYSLKSS